MTDKRPIVWAKMIYVCEDCKSMSTLYLENTLERHNGDKHKPVPFGIICPHCGGYHCYDRSFLIELPEERPVEDGELYFADTKKYDCGVVRIWHGPGSWVVEPDKTVIDNCLFKIYSNISPHTSATSVIAIKHYMQELYEELYGKGAKPKWMI